MSVNRKVTVPDGSSGIDEALTELGEAARDAARDRPRGDPELLADRAIALVAAEETVEHLLALVRKLGHRLAHSERIVELGDRVVDGVGLLLGRLFASCSRETVEADA